jgi:exonuclease III
MKHKLMSWNGRGLNDGDKRPRVKNLLKQWKADIICLQKSKLGLISRSLLKLNLN